MLLSVVVVKIILIMSFLMNFNELSGYSLGSCNVTTLHNGVSLAADSIKEMIVMATENVAIPAISYTASAIANNPNACSLGATAMLTCSIVKDFSQYKPLFVKWQGQGGVPSNMEVIKFVIRPSLKMLAIFGLFSARVIAYYLEKHFELMNFNQMHRHHR